MGRKTTNRNVFQAALDRLVKVYKEGHRVIVAFSGGKDSGVTLELAIMAANYTNRLPVEVVFRDDEILIPGTVEYLERTYKRPEVNMHWIYNRQGEPNIFNRKMPFWWAFDWELKPEQWVREPPPYAEEDLKNINLYLMITPSKYTPPFKKNLVSVVGIRTMESRNRLFAIQSSKGARSYAADDKRLISLYPIYDWSDGDVWKAVADNNWDYNRAYDALTKMGVAPSQQRLSQIAMSTVGLTNLAIASRAWPRWFDKVCDRLPGIRAVVYYGDRALQPDRHTDETWEECYVRSCIETAPPWIAERSARVKAFYENAHNSHSDSGLPDVEPCKICKYSWKSLSLTMYSGDPFNISIHWLPYLEPADFRESEKRRWPKSHKLPK